MIQFETTKTEKEVIIGDFLFRCFIKADGATTLHRYPKDRKWLPTVMYEVVVNTETNEIGLMHSFSVKNSDIHKSFNFKSEQDMLEFMESGAPVFDTPPHREASY